MYAPNTHVDGTPKREACSQLGVPEPSQMRAGNIRAASYPVDGLVQERKRRNDGKPAEGPVDRIETVGPLRELICVAGKPIGAGIDTQVFRVELQAQKPGDGRGIAGG